MTEEGSRSVDREVREDVRRRLLSTAGHVKGIARMVEEDTYCIDVIKQVQAVQAALTKVNTLILNNHLHTCVTEAIQGDDPAEREAVLKEITNVFAVKSR